MLERIRQTDANNGHALPTRRAHIGLALAVIVQLATSQFMEGPHRGESGNWVFTIHEISGMTALFLAFCFWLVVATRHRGTPAARLFPWFSAEALTDLWQDIRRQLGAVVKLRLPVYEEHAPLACAVHGLGLLLMSAMALTGTFWFFSHLFGAPENFLLHPAMVIHHLFANLVWAYLIGHALLAFVHHIAGQASLRRMWSLRAS